MREIKLNYNFMFKFVFSYFTVIFVSLLKNLVKRKTSNYQSNNKRIILFTQNLFVNTNKKFHRSNNTSASKLFVFFEKKKAQSPFLLVVRTDIIIIRRIRRVTRHEARFFDGNRVTSIKKWGRQIINEHGFEYAKMQHRICLNNRFFFNTPSCVHSLISRREVTRVISQNDSWNYSLAINYPIRIKDIKDISIIKDLRLNVYIINSPLRSFPTLYPKAVPD